MPALSKLVQERLQALEAAHLRRRLSNFHRAPGMQSQKNGKTLISFCDNDYLGLSTHPEVIAAAQAALKDGAGAGAARLISGNHEYYQKLETDLADFRGAPAACIFGSGYLANIGVIAALMDRQDLILADRLVHACILDGARLSGAHLLRFEHNNPEDCARMLASHRSQYRHCLIATEGIFSMDGDIAPLPELAAIAKQYDAWLMVDDAHGFGVLAGGRGTPHAYNLPIIPDILTGTLSKALGSYGGYVSGSADLIAYLQTAARSFMFSTALPPSVIAAAHASLSILRREGEKLTSLPLAHARSFAKQLDLPTPASAIVPILLGEAEFALQAAAVLEEEGFLVTAIRPPTVPEGTARLRFTFSATHREEDIQRLAHAIKKMGFPTLAAA